MIKKTIHLSDIHIRTFKRHEEYRVILSSLFENIKEKVKGYDREEIRIVVVGDLLHNKINISNEQSVLLAWFLKELVSIAPLIVVAGNHDLLENNKDRLDSITPVVDILGIPDIKYYKESKCYVDDNIVWNNYSIFEGNRRPEIEEARREYGDKKTYIGLFHGPLLSAETDLGYVFEHGMGLDEFLGNDIVMLGDIHKRSSFTLLDGEKTIPLVFPGSLIIQDFGESLSNHGYLFWDLETRTYEEINIESEYGFYKFKITSLDDLDNDKEILVNE